MARRAIIAGAGVGGLAAALALIQAGFRVAIYERADTLEEFGAGLQLTPNATRILAQLGALERVTPLASTPRAIVVLRGADDAELARMPLDDAERRWRAPYLVIHRADLQRALADAVRHEPRAELTLGATLLDFANEPDRVSVRLRSGSGEARDDADLLIGADGLRSQVREGLGFGARDRVEFAGRIAYRAIVDADGAEPRRASNAIVLRLGRNAHLVQYPLRRGSLTNLVATVSARSPAGAAERLEDRAIRSALERAYMRWSEEARSLIGAPVQWRAWPLYWRPPIASFSRGRVALIGDAAHPMVPFLAQGAAQAIEDAGALAAALAQTPDIPAALSTYSRNRVARAGRVQREALKLGRIYHMGGPLAVARDMTMRLMGARGMAGRYDWLYRA